MSTEMANFRTHEERITSESHPGSGFCGRESIFRLNRVSHQPWYQQDHVERAPHRHHLSAVVHRGSGSPFVMTNIEERKDSFMTSSSATVSQRNAAFYHCQRHVDNNAQCSCNECARHYWHNYHFRHSNHAYGRSFSPYANPSYERPSVRRRISPDPRIHSGRSAYVSTHGESGHGMPTDNGAIDSYDQEVEMITSRQVNDRLHPHYDQSRQHGGCHEYSETTYHRQQTPHLSYSPHYVYHPYPNPYFHPYPHYGHTRRVQDAPHQDAPHQMPMRHATIRKRKQYDEFLLRPQKDYIIYADRSGSPCSDITSSPTPSLDMDSFDIQESTECHQKDKIVVVNTDVPVLEIKPIEPRIERHSSKDNTSGFDFNIKEREVRMVSPVKPKASEEKIHEKFANSVWREREDELDQFVAISKNITESSSE
jgi:hypothetical protein